MAAPIISLLNNNWSEVMYELTIKRSPARVTWGIWLGDALITTTDTKAQAEHEVQKLEKLL